MRSTADMSLRLRRGEWVEVRSEAEIRATLDALRDQARALGAEIIVADGHGHGLPDPPALPDVVRGPAIIEDAWSTVVVPPGWQAKADAAGHLFLTRATA